MYYQAKISNAYFIAKKSSCILLLLYIIICQGRLTKNLILFFFRIGPGTYDFKMNLKGSGIGKSLPPRGIQMFKGYKNVALTRLTYSDASGLNRKPVFRFFKSENIPSFQLSRYDSLYFTSQDSH